MIPNREARGQRIAHLHNQAPRAEIEEFQSAQSGAPINPRKLGSDIANHKRLATTYRHFKVSFRNKYFRNAVARIFRINIKFKNQTKQKTVHKLWRRREITARKWRQAINHFLKRRFKIEKLSNEAQIGDWNHRRNRLQQCNKREEKQNNQPKRQREKKWISGPLE